MMSTKAIQDLLAKDMDRKQFLQAVGAALLGIIGLTAFLKNIDKFAKDQTGTRVSRHGYGSAPYGK